MKRALRGLEDRTAYWTRWNLGEDGRINPPALSLLVPLVDHWQHGQLFPPAKHHKPSSKPRHPPCSIWMFGIAFLPSGLSWHRPLHYREAPWCLGAPTNKFEGICEGRAPHVADNLDSRYSTPPETLLPPPPPSSYHE